MRNFLNKLFTGQQGSVAVTVAVAMVVLMAFSAFVLDFGYAYVQASRLQNALDSAVLAAVQELPADNTASTAWASAKNEAAAFAALNKLTINQSDIQPVYKDNIAGNEIIGIKAAKSITVDYNFARVIGINSGTVTRAASAGISPAGSVTGAVPLSISSSALNSAIANNAVTGLTIKSSSNAGDIKIDYETASGWFGALRFEGTGASVYSTLLASGYSGALHVGQVLDMENGNMSGPTLEGFTTRYSKCTNGCTAENYEPDCPRLVYVPVIEAISNSQVKIVGFAPFFLLECGGSGNDSYIKATYIKDIVLSDKSPGAKGQDFGLYVSRLFE